MIAIKGNNDPTEDAAASKGRANVLFEMPISSRVWASNALCAVSYLVTSSAKAGCNPRCI